ncbi:Myb/SANT-like DNA-binding domain, partial [Phytophthora infestans]
MLQLSSEDPTRPEDDAAIIPVHTRTSSGQCAPRRRNQGRNETKHPFAWTVNAAEVLLRLRFDSLKGLFDGTKNSKQLSAAWDYLAAETHRIGGLEVDATQCKSKLKHMHKQYTAYRVALEATGNATERPLNEPPCYDTMVDVWGDLEGMGAEPFFSSDASSLGIEQATEVQRVVESDDRSSGVGSNVNGVNEGGQSTGWRRYSGKRNRGKEEGMKAIGNGLSDIAAAFKAARTQRDETQSCEILSSLQELTKTVQAQTQAVNNLLQYLSSNSDSNNANTTNS